MYKIQNRKPIQELSLFDDFLFTEAMLNKKILFAAETQPLLSGSY